MFEFLAVLTKDNVVKFSQGIMQSMHVFLLVSFGFVLICMRVVVSMSKIKSENHKSVSDPKTNAAPLVCPQSRTLSVGGGGRCGVPLCVV